MSIQKRKVILVIFGCFLPAFLASCNKEDLGTPCAVDEKKWSEGVNKNEIVVGEEPVITDEQILQDGICETFICLNHLNMPPYCSRRCDDNNPCPDGFTCQAVQDLGAHAGEAYCVFAPCEKDSDCQDVKLYQCATIASTTTDATATFKRCQPRTSDKDQK